MTNDEFFGQFGHLAEAPDGIARLKRLILDLAVRGRLVPQDPSDEPASVLLERIAEERERLVLTKEIKEVRPLSTEAREVPFSVPENWEWATLEDFCVVIMGTSPKSETFTESPDIGTPFLQGNAEFGAINPTPRKGTTKPVRVSPAGAVLVSVRAPVGATNITPSEVAIGRGLAALVPLDSTPLSFIFWMLRSFRAALEDRQRGTTFPAITAPVLRGFLVPVPPVMEQHRIVERIEELMGTCDELNEAQLEACELRAATARSSLSALVESGKADTERALSIIKNHMRLSLSPGDGAAEVVTELRKSVLDLAVRGRLVPTDPASEAASVDLWSSRRDEWTAPTARDKRNRSSTTGYPLGSGALPEHWRYARIEEVAQLINGRAYKKDEWRDEGTPVLRIQNLNGGDSFYFSDLELPDHNYCEKDDLLFAWSASFGPYIWGGGRSIFHYHIWKVLTSPAVERSFMFLLLKAMTEAVRSASHGLAMLHMTKGAMEGLVVPVPPIDEQHRIVRRVQEMMALCDELEQQLLAERALAADLAESAVSSLLAQVA